MTMTAEAPPFIPAPLPASLSAPAPFIPAPAPVNVPRGTSPLVPAPPAPNPSSLITPPSADQLKIPLNPVQSDLGEHLSDPVAEGAAQRASLRVPFDPSKHAPSPGINPSDIATFDPQTNEAFTAGGAKLIPSGGAVAPDGSFVPSGPGNDLSQGALQSGIKSVGNAFSSTINTAGRALFPNNDVSLDSALAALPGKPAPLPVNPEQGAANAIGSGVGGALPFLVPGAAPVIGGLSGVGSAEDEGQKRGYSGGQTAALAAERGAFNTILGLIPGGPSAGGTIKGFLKAASSAYGVNIAQAGVEAKLKNDLGIKSDNEFKAMYDRALAGDNAAMSALIGVAHGVMTRGAERPEINQPTREPQNAQGIRENPRPSGVEGNADAGGQSQRGKNLELQAQAQPSNEQAGQVAPAKPFVSAPNPAEDTAARIAKNHPDLDPVKAALIAKELHAPDNPHQSTPESTPIHTADISPKPPFVPAPSPENAPVQNAAKAPSPPASGVGTESDGVGGEGDDIGQRGLSEGPPGPLQVGIVGQHTPFVQKVRNAIQSSVGAVRAIRERFAPVESRYGSDIAKSLIKVAAAPSPEAKTISDSFFRRAFGGTSDPAQYEKDFTDLGRYYRLKDLQDRATAAGKNPADVGQGLPQLPPSEVSRLENDPHIQKAVGLYNQEIAPMLTDIRQRNGMLMNPNASKMPFFLNLPGEFEGPKGTDTSVNPNLAFNKPAVGNSTLLPDPRESMEAAIRGHLATDYKQELVNTIKTKYSVPPNAVVPDPNSSRGFLAKLNGRTDSVEPVDLAPAGSPAPDLHYVPKMIADKYNKIQQEHGEYDTLFDKAVNLGTRVATAGDFAPHSARVVAHAAARMAQAGNNPLSLAPSWLGSNEAAIARMKQMVRSPLGETMQLLIDRTGSDKGAGFNVQPGKSAIGRLAAKPHDLLFNPEYGVDPMARRTVADAHHRTVLGNDVMDKLERALNSGATNPIEASKSLEKQLADRDFVGLGRKVNGTMGFANKQTRSELLNWGSRIFPFISSESGMIPREIAKLANFDPAGLSKTIKRGDWVQAAKQIGGSLATGAIGTYLAANALNYANTKAQTGKGRMMSDNEDGHKLDVWLAPGWYVSNLDPTFSRPARLTGVQALANGKNPKQAAGVAGVEGVNEVLSTLAKSLQVAFTTATAMGGHPMAPYLATSKKGEPGLMRTSVKDAVGMPFVRNTARAVSQGTPIKSGLIKDSVSDLTGLQLKSDKGK